MFSIAYRSAAPNSVLTWGESVVKRTLDGETFVEVTRNGGTFRLAYTDFADLTEPDVMLGAVMSEDPPDVFKGDLSHTFDGTALIPTGWTPEPDPEV